MPPPPPRPPSSGAAWRRGWSPRARSAPCCSSCGTRTQGACRRCGERARALGQRLFAPPQCSCCGTPCCSSTCRKGHQRSCTACCLAARTCRKGRLPCAGGCQHPATQAVCPGCGCRLRVRPGCCNGYPLGLRVPCEWLPICLPAAAAGYCSLKSQPAPPALSAPAAPNARQRWRWCSTRRSTLPPSPLPPCPPPRSSEGLSSSAVALCLLSAPVCACVGMRAAPPASSPTARPWRRLAQATMSQTLPAPTRSGLMSQYLALFDAAGRLSTLRDAEFVAMLQLMGRTGAVSPLCRPAFPASLWPCGARLPVGLLQARSPGLHLPAPGSRPGLDRPGPVPHPTPRHPHNHNHNHNHHPPTPTDPQVFSPLQKARLVAAAHPYFPGDRRSGAREQVSAGSAVTASETISAAAGSLLLRCSVLHRMSSDSVASSLLLPMQMGGRLQAALCCCSAA